ncbi:hypothetical protein HN51_063840 [Arachis hypogaea]|uniref:GATA-type domain-containing protein n=2 Tax=Arachis TaxID=3817 RepID=A0A445ELW4_ARAHY|nr:GATA transcription factor 15 [Arachis duranensis]XP_016177795.1 GATA transcription factor 15 [Arachis ipaensis]XP_025610703.1 GATA transcription factor 15 [Arachis hypogaea]XP_025630166.1 GATA transcription factor 15 [Arachis hypogaea]XP_057723634.1 GATA transcription factor 15-like [Arachis stenosperma]QHO21441.1 GATA transcription factor [Arachis hypogaea]QHO50811.1 GATA transcription factor [Arachis hypogaea]RYR30810.1 hypothetical protein Ahy_B01g055580 [Arachis hypogaea]RYR76447.1 h
MVDSTGKGSDSSGGGGKSPTTELKKTCADCGTSKTPLWRGGPAGPKSLCNACGIRSRKKKRAILGITRGTADDVKKGKRSNTAANNSLNFKQRFMALARQVMTKKSNNLAHSHRNKLGEEEQAAVLLMSLSYGSVYA